MAGKDTTHQVSRVKQLRRVMERRLEERTLELTNINAALQTVIAERNRANQEISLLLTITQAVREAENLQSALASTLRTVCEVTAWDYAEAWTLSPDGAAFSLSSVWHKEHPNLEKFKRLSRTFSIVPGIGLGGRVCISKRPEWIRNVSTVAEDLFRRNQIAAECGLKAALAVPIPAAGTVIAIFIFLMMKTRAQDKRLVDIVSAVAAQLGSAIRHKQTEEALEKHEAFLRAIIDNSSRLIYLKDRDGKYLTINRRSENLFHVAKEEIAGKTDRDIFPEEVAAVFHSNDRKVLEAGVAMEFEEAVPQDDGLHTYLSNKYPMFDSTGAPYAVCGISTDITEQKRQEEALRAARDILDDEVRKRTAQLAETNQALVLAVKEREEMLQRLQRERDFSASLIDTAQVIVLLLDCDGEIVHFNAYFGEITGYSLDEVKGQSWFATFLPEGDRERMRNLFRTALSGVRTKGNVNPIVTKDGRERDIEWFDKTLKDAAGETIGLLCIGQDITERRKAESWLQGLVRTTQDALVSIDATRRIVLFNPAAERIFGYKAEEIVGRKVEVLMGEPYALEHDDYLDHYEHSGEARAIGRIRTVKARRKNGEVFPIELSVAQIAGDHEVRYAAFMRDISEKTHLQEKLIESERLAAIGATAAKIGHELANPLNGMYLAVQLLEQRLGKQPQRPDDGLSSTVKKIRTEIARLTELLKDFRSLSRREKYSFRRTTVADLAAQVMEIELPHCTALGIEVEHDFPPDLPPIFVDSDKMKQALLNLCKNAAEAMPGGGKLRVKASVFGKSVVLEITDSGVGIPSDMDIFEPFSTTKPQSTGLGLVIVRQIIIAHGGEIMYRSEPGRGTTFRITLPLNPTALET